MKRSSSIFAFLAVILLGCSVFSAATQAATAPPAMTDNRVVTKETAGTDTPVETDKPVATLKPTAKANLPAATNTTCNELTFFLDPGLEASIKCTSVPEFGGPDSSPFDTHPQYTKISVIDYPLRGRIMQPVISVFPVRRYRELLPDMVGPDIAALEALIAGGNPGDIKPPILPVQNATQLFLAQFEVLQFQNGSGVRYVTQYGQAYVPPNNHGLFFSFQGLTSDGEYWISVLLPISHPSLWENEGVTTNTEYSAIESNPDAYYAAKSIDISALDPKTFVPSIKKLDTLVRSMLVKPPSG
jgi:hypothetical protein